MLSVYYSLTHCGEHTSAGTMAASDDRVSQPATLHRKRVAVLGHSYIRRLALDMTSSIMPDIQPGFGLAQCDVRCRGFGGLRITDNHRQFLLRFRPLLQTYKLHVVIIQLGGNDIDNATFTDARCRELASALDDLGERLTAQFGVHSVLYASPLRDLDPLMRPQHSSRKAVSLSGAT